MNVTSPHEAQEIVKAKAAELLAVYNITFYTGRRKQRSGDTINIEWMSVDYDPKVIRDDPRGVPTPRTKAEHEIEIRLANAGAREQDISAWMRDLMALPGALSGDPSQGQTWYWKTAERGEYDLTEDNTPSSILMRLGFDEMI